MKKIFLFLTLAVLCTIQTHAVLKERDLAQTIAVLRSELKNYNDNMEQRMVRYQKINDQQHQQMMKTMQQCNQLSLMIYSQRTDYTFDMAYACSEATSLYHQYSRGQAVPYEKILHNMDIEIQRYEGLINSLQSIQPFIGKAKADMMARMAQMPDSIKHKFQLRMEEMKKKGQSIPQLSKESQKQRAECITYCENILKMFKQMRTQLNDDKENYERISKRLKELNDYAEKRYMDLQATIFKNGSKNYFNTLGSLSRVTRNAKEDIEDKYSFEANKEAHSQWKGPIVIFLSIFVLIYLIIAGILSTLLIRVFIPLLAKYGKHIPGIKSHIFILQHMTEQEWYKKKKVCINLALAFVIFAITVMIVRNSMPNNNFFLMASELLIEFAWLVGVILISLLVRLNGDQIKPGFQLYTPIILMGFIIISFRIIFIPNDIIELVFPPVLLLFTIWQFVSVKKIHKHLEEMELAEEGNEKKFKLDTSDQIYTWIAFISMAVSTVLSWCGYTLLAVQVFIWWLFQLTAIQTITCIYYVLEKYKRSFVLDRVIEYRRKATLRNLRRRYDIARYQWKANGCDPAKEPKKSDAIKSFEELKADYSAACAQAQAEGKPTPQKNKYLIKFEEDLKDKEENKKKEKNKPSTADKKEAEDVMTNDKGEYIRITFLYDFVEKALVPIVSVASVLFCIYWAASVFNMQESCRAIFLMDFVNIPETLRLSLFRICVVVGLYFIFKFLSYSLKAWYRYFKKKQAAMREEREQKIITVVGTSDMTNYTLTDNITVIVVWGIYCIFVMKWFSISTTSISLITAGLATGVGFAMKDLLENFFYGMSLMTGRLHVGDYIECDDIRGKVESITYQSVQISTADGSTIAFLNSSLFSKNFKNLTKNHMFEMVKIPVGVAYGVDVEKVRKLLVDMVKREAQVKDKQGREMISSSRGISVAFSDFGDNSVNLFVVFWVLVEDKIAACGRVKEGIYNTLNDNHIEIPFPQRDINIRTVQPLILERPTKETQAVEKPSEN